jgi:hypothetical protein
MKNAAALAMLLALLAVPALAEDGAVPRPTLLSLGLGDLQRISDAQSMQVRGQASFFSRVRGTSLLFGRLYEPATNTTFEFSTPPATVDVQSTTTGTLTGSHSLNVSWYTPISIRSIVATVGGVGTVTISHR